MVFFQRHCRPISFGVSPPLKSGTLFIYSFGWRPSGATTRRKPKKPCACENWYKKAIFGRQDPRFQYVTQGTLLELSLTLRPVCHGPTKAEAGAGAPSYIGRGDMQKKYVQGSRQAGGRCRQRFLFVLWILLVFWVGNWAKKTQERTRSRRSRLNKTQSHQSRHSPFSRPSVLVAFG